MNIGVRPGQVAQGLKKPTRLGFHHKPRVLTRRQPVTGDCEAEFERHIEPWRSWRGRVEFHTRKIMKRVATFSDQVDNPIQSPGTTGNLQRSAWRQTVADKTSDVCQKQIREFPVIGDVEKGIAPADAGGRGHLFGGVRLPECAFLFAADARSLVTPFGTVPPVGITRSAKARNHFKSAFDTRMIRAVSSGVGKGVLMTTLRIAMAILPREEPLR